MDEQDLERIVNEETEDGEVPDKEYVRTINKDADPGYGQL